jgi:predicted aspartyl protease
MKFLSNVFLSGVASVALLSATAGAREEESAEFATDPITPATTLELHRTHGGQYAIPTIVEGQGPMDFLVDTGANRTAVLSPLAVKLGLLSQEDHEAMLYGLTGSVMTRLLDVQRLDFGAGDVGPLETALIPLGPDVYLTAYGVLGADAFEDDIIAIDLDNEQLRIGVPPPAPSVQRHLFTLDEQGLLRATIRVGGVTATAIIDTGSTRTIGNSSLMNAVGGSRPAMFVDLSGITAARGDQAGTVLMESVRLGSVCRRSFRMLRADLDIFDTLEIQGPAVIVGLDYLEGSTITIDRPNGRFTVAGASGTCRGRSSSLRD